MLRNYTVNFSMQNRWLCCFIMRIEKLKAHFLCFVQDAYSRVPLGYEELYRHKQEQWAHHHGNMNRPSQSSPVFTVDVSPEVRPSDMVLLEVCILGKLHHMSEPCLSGVKSDLLFLWIITLALKLQSPFWGVLSYFKWVCCSATDKSKARSGYVLKIVCAHKRFETHELSEKDLAPWRLSHFALFLSTPIFWIWQPVAHWWVCDRMLSSLSFSSFSILRV